MKKEPLKRRCGLALNTECVPREFYQLPHDWRKEFEESKKNIPELEPWTMKIVKNEPDYFVTFETTPGHTLTQIQGKLEVRWNELHINNNPAASKLLEAFTNIHLSMPSKVAVASPSRRSGETFELLQQAIGPLLHNMVYSPNERPILTRHLIQLFTLACKGWANRGGPPQVHGRSKKFKTSNSSSDGSIPQASAILAIEHARLFFDLHRRLPTKLELKQCLIKSQPEMDKWQAPYWTRILKAAGLSELTSAKPWQSK